MKYVLGILILAASVAPAFAVQALPSPGPELAMGAPAVLAVIGSFVATRLPRFRRKK